MTADNETPETPEAPEQQDTTGTEEAPAAEESVSEERMEGGEDGLPTRMKILLRLLYTVLFLVVFEILRLVVQIVVVVQYVILFITRKPSEPLRGFGNKVAAYTYRLLRYITLSESVPPYPLSAFPTEPDPLEEEARFE